MRRECVRSVWDRDKAPTSWRICLGGFVFFFNFFSLSFLFHTAPMPRTERQSETYAWDLIFPWVHNFNLCNKQHDRIILIFLCVCIVFSEVRENRQNNGNFSVWIYTHRKITRFFCEYLDISVGIFETHTLITNFSVCIDKNAQKNSTPTGVFEFPVV